MLPITDANAAMSGLGGNARLASKWLRRALAVLAVNGLAAATANAYTAAGDRNFPATLVLPQIAPSDAFWFTPSTQPTTKGQQTQVTGTYSKLITERFSIQAVVSRERCSSCVSIS